MSELSLTSVRLLVVLVTMLAVIGLVIFMVRRGHLRSAKRFSVGQRGAGASAAQHTEREPLPSGLTLLDYTIMSVLGKGGCGITYLAEDTDNGQKVALKEFFPDTIAGRGPLHTVTVHPGEPGQAFNRGLQRFIEEARVLAGFDHPNIVRVKRFFHQHDTAYMVMPYQEGFSLGQLRRRKVQFDQRTLMQLMKPLLEGLGVVHTAGFLHRDIKPSNIFLCSNNVPILLDFGAVCYLTPQSAASITPIVTPGFAPIEQYSSNDPLGPWSDIYALGAVLYLLVTGGMPPEAPARVRFDSFRSATQVADVGRYGKNLLQAIDWALQLQPQRRPRSLPEFTQALFWS